MPTAAGLAALSRAASRSISPENPTGAPGAGGRAGQGTGAAAARDLGVGWKVSPSIVLPPGVTTLAAVAGPGTITHLWMTIHPAWWRRVVLRIFWDEESTPSVQVPIGDFFCNGWCDPTLVNSAMVAVGPRGGFNSYWPMPFRTAARIEVDNLSGQSSDPLYYSVDYQLADVEEGAGYLHAQFARSNPVADGLHTVLSDVRGWGHYVGTYLAWQSNNTGWWGEGELKFFIDDDEEFPTICGTGTEDYFGGAWDFEQPEGHYRPFSTAYLGLPQVIGAGEGGLYASQQRFGMYRWHVADPIRFTDRLSVSVQALGWRSGGRYLRLRDDVASTAFWYQAEPHAPLRPLPDADGLEVV